MKKLIVFLLAIVMVMSVSLVAFAEETTDVVLNYTGEDGTTAKITFNTTEKTVAVEMLVAGMYSASYNSTYAVTEGVLTVADVADVTATDITGFAAMLGLPATMQINLTHVAENGVLSISRSAGGEAPVLTCTFNVDADTMSKLNPVTETPGETPTDTPTETPDNPKTGAPGVGVFVALMAVSAMGIGAVAKKKH